MIRRALPLATALCFLAVSACGLDKLTNTDVAATPKFTTTQSIWINANWTANATGLPNGTVKSVTPNNLTGSVCPATSVLLYLHTSPIPEWKTFGGIVLMNNCSIHVDYLYCSTAGGSQTNDIPKCDVDPRTTPLSRLLTLGLNAGGKEYLGNSTLNAGINVFYCPSGNLFALGIIAGAAPTDCYKP